MAREAGDLSEHDLDCRDMRELSGGSHQALERLYTRYASRLAGFFWRMGADASAMDELVQDAFVRLWRHGSGWRGEGRFSTYLFGIARSAWVESRSAARRPAIPADELRRGIGPAQPDGELERSELRREIGEALAALPEGHRDVVSLATAGGLKYREIAELLGIPMGTVKSRMAAAEEKLRERLGRYLAR